MFVDIAVKAVVVQIIYSAVILAIDKIASKGKS